MNNKYRYDQQRLNRTRPFVMSSNAPKSDNASELLTEDKTQ